MTMDNLPPPYEPIRPDGSFQPASEQQLAAFIPEYREKYAALARAADVLTQLESQIKQCESELAATVEAERAITNTMRNFPVVNTFMTEWAANRSHGNA
jgi:hypothetical protein